MPLCKVNYDRSEVRDFSSDKDQGHQYLSLVFVPVKMSLLQRASAGRVGSEYQMNFYPQRDSQMEINEEFEAELIEAFNNKQLEDCLVGRAEVPIPPTVMTYSSDTKTHQKGEIIMEGNEERIYTSIQITCLMKMVDGKEVPINSANELKTRALAIRKYRIDAQEWYEPQVKDQQDPDADANIVVDEPPVTPIVTPPSNGTVARPRRQ